MKRHLAKVEEPAGRHGDDCRSRNAQAKRAVPQRARKKRRVIAVHTSLANRCRDFHHQLAARLVRDFDYIAVGNVNAAALAKTPMAKSVLDASWSTLQNTLAFKEVRQGAWFEEVDERFTTQICSGCGNMPLSRLMRIADLGSMSTEHAKERQCNRCSFNHDRDVNAALHNLCREGARLAAGITVLSRGEDVIGGLLAPSA